MKRTSRPKVRQRHQHAKVSISHELNQPLTGIKGFAQSALQHLDKNSPIRKDLQRIIQQADRIKEILKNA
jgi:signal transduction histidine kinase